MVKVIVGYKYSVGGLRESLQPELEILEYEAGDMLYLLTDGLIDQPVQQSKGLKRRLWANWVEEFHSIARKPFSEQKDNLEAFIENQLVYHEQRDDITLMAIIL